MQTWMVRAGRSGRFFDSFREQEIVSIGWSGVGDIGQLKTREAVMAAVKAAYPDYSDQTAAVATGQMFRFAHQFQIGDRVVTYDPRARIYLCGEITGNFTYKSDAAEEEYLCQRKVRWSHETPRDRLSAEARSSLGALSTVFTIAPQVSDELWGRTSVSVPGTPAEALQTPTVSLVPVASPDFEALANEAIKDRIAAFDWEQMQDLVAGLLRAMGYKTTVSPPGPDRGKDITASPDGFGFQDPRIVVEVKHRPGTRMGAQEIRSFLGGRHAGDKGLYVSTGGFSKDAYYEAERANIRLHLMDFKDLLEAIQEHYANFDEETRALLPLKRIYWPVAD